MATRKEVTSRLRAARTPRRSDRSFKNVIERLPSEILIKILSYLDAPTLFSLSHVSKLFYQLANDNALWNKIYMAHFDKNKKRKPKCMDEMLLNMATVELQDCAPGYWKWLFFKTVAACDLYKWERQLGFTSRHTGLPSQTERILRNLHVTWELVVWDKSGREATLELSRSAFCEISVYLCWSGGGRLTNHQQISSLQLYGVRRVALNCPGLKSPGWRSVMAKLEMQTLTKNAQFLRRERLIEMKLLHPGIIIGTWRGQSSVAFIMFSLHFHRLVEKSIQGSSFCSYVVPMVKPPMDDIDPDYGLHGYQLHIVLHNTVCTLMSGSFSQLFCHKTQIGDGLLQLTAISRTNLSQHTPLSGNINLPWRCEALQGVVENCCIMSLTLLDEFRNPFWCVSSPVTMEQENTPTSYDYDGEPHLIHYLDSDGQAPKVVRVVQGLHQSGHGSVRQMLHHGTSLKLRRRMRQLSFQEGCDRILEKC